MSGVPILETPWSNLQTMIKEVGSNGGSWYPGQERFTLKAHQTVGGVSDLFFSESQMVMKLRLPSDLWVKGATYTWSLVGCMINTACKGDNSWVQSDLLATSVRDLIPACPAMSSEYVRWGKIDTAIHNNPFFIGVGSSLTNWTTGDLCSFNVGQFKFQLDTSTATSGSSDAGVAGSNTADTMATSSTSSSSPADATNTNPLVINLGSTTLTTKAAQMTTLSNGVVVPFLDPSPSSSDSAPSSGDKGGRHPKVAAISAGATAGAVLVILTLLLIWWRRRHKRGLKGWQLESEMKFGGLGSHRSNHGSNIQSLAQQTATSAQSETHPLQQLSPPGSTSGSLSIHQIQTTNSSIHNADNANNVDVNAFGAYSDVQTPHSLPMYTSTIGDTPPSYRPVITPYTPMNRQLLEGRTPAPAYFSPGSFSSPNARPSPSAILNSNSGSSGGSRARNRRHNHGSPPDLNDALGVWARDNRRVIPMDLERRLRLAGYSPDYNPDGMDEQIWLDRYDVNAFEIQHLRRLFLQRSMNTDGEGVTSEDSMATVGATVG